MKRCRVLQLMVVFCLFDTAFAEETDANNRPGRNRRRYRAARREANEDLNHAARTYNDTIEEANRRIANARQIAPTNTSNTGIIVSANGPIDRGTESIVSALKTGIVGQPEVIDALTRIEMRKKIIGKGLRTKPELLYMMGLPGTGKDHSAAVYSKALNGPKGAEEDMFEMPVARSKADLWNVFGSTTGYIGSNKELPRFIHFLVRHSSGRYYIKASRDSNGENGKESVHENTNWRPGDLIPGYKHPEDAVVFVNEFHSWDQESKNMFFVDGFEKGKFPINDPGTGLRFINVPVNFLIASNDGIELIVARDHFGHRIGPPATYERIMSAHQRVANDKLALITAMKERALKTIGREVRGGLSEELANRLPPDRVVLMRPLSVTDIEQIAFEGLVNLGRLYGDARGEYGRIKVKFAPKLPHFLANYAYNPEEGARLLKSRIAAMIEDPLNRFIVDQLEPSHLNYELTVDINTKKDGTAQLVINYSSSQRGESFAALDIDLTAVDALSSPLTAETIDTLNSLGDRINARVFGIDHVAAGLRHASLMLADAAARANKDAGGVAKVFMFLGPSSVGKTETAKVLADELDLAFSERTTINFNNIRTVQDMREAILGTTDYTGAPKKSQFMEQYDINNGRVVFTFDEISNAPRELLKTLYDLFREPKVGGFSDGKPRSMRDVIIICTGNAGEEIYEDIPRSIPKFMQMAAFQKIYSEFMKDPGQRREVLEKYFSEALVNRIGESNIFFFPHLSFLALRKLSLARVKSVIAELKPPHIAAMGWNVGFASNEDLEQMLQVTESDGLVIREQGASIVRFVASFASQLRDQLLSRHVAREAKVKIQFLQRVENKDENRADSIWRISTEQEQFDLVVRGNQDSEHLHQSDDTKIITAYHEVGHELVRHTLLGDKFVSKRISIIPGVSRFGERWLHILGISESRNVEYMEWTRQGIVEQIAVQLAGEVAEELVSGQFTGGKMNDIEKATTLAHRAILQLGLSKRWGNHALPTGMTIPTYLQTLTTKQKELLHSEVDRILSEARRLARATIMANFDSHFLPMSLALAEKGEFNAEEIAEFYKTKDSVKVATKSPFAQCVSNCLANLNISEWISKWMEPQQREPKLRSERFRPKQVADIERFIGSQRLEELAGTVDDDNGPTGCGLVFEGN